MNVPTYLNHYQVPNPKDHNYGDMATDYPEIMPGDVDAYGNRYRWEVRANIGEEDSA